jgi:hypothetical protein
MNGARRLPVLQLLERHTEIIEEVLVNEVDPTVGCRGRNGRGQAIDDLRKRELVFHTTFRCAMPRVAESTVTLYRYDQFSSWCAHGTD